MDYTKEQKSGQNTEHVLEGKNYRDRKKRVELACHTGYSRMDGIGLESDWIGFADENGIDTLVITDSGNVDSYIDMQNQIERSGQNIRLIMGADLLVTDDRDVEGKAAGFGRLSVLIRNETGKRNLYKILSEGERKYKGDGEEPVIPLSLLLCHRNGLLIGSGTRDSLLINAVLCIEVGKGLGEIMNVSFDADRDNYGFFDYIEIPYEDKYKWAKDDLMELACDFNIPATVVCAPHYMRKEESKAYEILRSASDAGVSGDSFMHYLSTDEVLEQFAYLGEEEAYELVVINSNIIADMCDCVPAIPDKKIFPYIDNQDEILRRICEDNLDKKYPDATDDIRSRLEWELAAIRESKSAFMFLQAEDVIEKLGLYSYEVGSRGNVGSSIVAYLCGISEIDPIKAKLSPYFFYGYKGNREPDIDLNFAISDKAAVDKAFETAPGVGPIIKPGLFAYVSERYADKLIDDYCDNNYYNFWGETRHKLVDSLTKCVRKRTCHQGGLILLPKGVEIDNICPVTVDTSAGSRVTMSAYNYHSTDRVFSKFDALTHDSQEILKRLHALTGADPADISTEDPEVMELFKFGDADSKTLPGCAGIAEFGSEFAIEVLKESNPQDFDDLVKIVSVMHGTDTWIDNAQTLIKEGEAALKDIPTSRDDVFDYLTEHDIDTETAFKITENVRKGKVARGRCNEWDDFKKIMFWKNIPYWFVKCCEKINYMFPRAHSYSYTLATWRIAWYKLHFPLEFYKTVLEVSQGDSFTYKYMGSGKNNLNLFMDFLDSSYAAPTLHKADAEHTCLLLNDYYDHGFEFRSSEDDGPEGDRFTIVDNHTIEVKINRFTKQSEDVDEYDGMFYI